MSASDLDRRRLATTEFLNSGLGDQLTSTARFLLRYGSGSQLAIAYACGNIIERVLWAGLGAWMGYFEDMPLVSDEESAILREYAPLLAEMKIVQNLWDSPGAVTNFDLSGRSVGHQLIWENLALFPLKQKMIEWFPTFQAALIASEMLTDESITSFFLFLRIGNVEQFKEHQLSADEVLNQLSQTHTVWDTFHEVQAHPELVVAGFIRYTEFLSAMESIFPSLDIRPDAAGSSDIFRRIVDRDLLFLNARAFRWRFPQGESAQIAFKAVVRAFIQFTARELGNYPEMGVQWSRSHTWLEILALSQKFFSPGKLQNSEETEGQEDPEIIAERNRRSVALRARILQLSE